MSEAIAIELLFAVPLVGGFVGFYLAFRVTAHHTRQIVREEIRAARGTPEECIAGVRDYLNRKASQSRELQSGGLHDRLPD